MKENNPKPLILNSDIQKRVKTLGEQISLDYKNKELVCVGILKGSIIFYADLVRCIDRPVVFDFISASSYANATESSGVVNISKDLSLSIEGKHVLVIEDIVDTGNTLSFLLDHLKLKRPASLKLCAFLFKPSRVKREVKIDYLGFTIDDHFVVGYGLDVAEKYRNLNHVAIYEESPDS